MNRFFSFGAAVTGAALALTTASTNSHAALLAYYGDGLLVDAPALANIAPVNADITVSSLSDVGAQTGDPVRITRNAFSTPTPAGPTAGSAIGSEWFEARSTENQGTPSSTDNYFVFTVDAEPGFLLNLEELRYDFWVSPTTSATTSADVEAFVSVDGGSFVSFGSITAIDNDGDANVAAPVATANLDLSSITGAESVEVRIGVGYSQGNSAGISGFAQGIQLEGSVVPEPASIALLGLGGLMMLRRRRA